MKECNFCHQVKPLDQFRHGAKCRSCELVYEFNRREKKREYLKKWRARNPDKVRIYEENKLAKRKHKPPSSKIYVKTCIYSGELFVARGSTAKVSPKYRDAYIKLKNQQAWDKLRETKRCPECHKSFRGTKGTKFCSKKCCRLFHHRLNQIRDKINGSPIERVERLEVFNTYSWTCAICGVATPKELLGTCEPHAPTVDHIIPLSKGGTHTYDNCQLLCFACNCSKNDMIDPPDELVLAGNILIHLNNKIYENERAIKRPRANGYSGQPIA
jgi:5-methylcytosine-specific restriction endonuclease McrA